MAKPRLLMSKMYWLILSLLALANSQAPIQGFRPPSVPLFVQSPLWSLWSSSDTLYGDYTRQWTGRVVDFSGLIKVNTDTFVFMGKGPGAIPLSSNKQDALEQDDEPRALPNCVQTSVTALSTRTIYVFQCGSAVTLKAIFTSPLLTTNYDQLSQPAQYLNFEVTTNAAVKCSIYVDFSAQYVIKDATTAIQWQRVNLGGGIMALRVGGMDNQELKSTDDVPDWGFLYMIVNTSQSTSALGYANNTRNVFIQSGGLPLDQPGGTGAMAVVSDIGRPTGPQPGIDRPGADLKQFSLPSPDVNLCWKACNDTAGCTSWAYAVVSDSCGTDPTCWLKNGHPSTVSNACRVSGDQGAPSGYPFVEASVFDLGTIQPGTVYQRLITLAVDEVLSLNYFGEVCPPYWRRALPIGDASAPMDMLRNVYSTAVAVYRECESFDANNAAMLSAVGGDEYSTITQLTYRQVFGAMALVWIPSKNTPYYFLKEISSCGCLNTQDVIYPAFPQILYYSPELMKLMIISHLEYATNKTNQPYPLPWAPHHLGFWPIANLPYSQQENMPLEQTSWDMLIILAIALRQGNDVSWLAPYWPVLKSWYTFLHDLLPFPQEQLSTDDFDGPLYNATNLAIKGLAGMAAWGCIYEAYTGDSAGAEVIFNTTAQYAQTMIDYSWVEASDPADSHFMIGYKGSQKDGGDPKSWPMIYNALWLRLLGFNLLPDQQNYIDKMGKWYQSHVMNQYGVPLNSRATFTKDDWMTFLAALYYDADNKPTDFSNKLFDGYYQWANVTTYRSPISDWSFTDSPAAAGFTNRPVLGAMYAPVLISQGPPHANPVIEHANRVFAKVHSSR